MVYILFMSAPPTLCSKPASHCVLYGISFKRNIPRFSPSEPLIISRVRIPLMMVSSRQTPMRCAPHNRPIGSLRSKPKFLRIKRFDSTVYWTNMNTGGTLLKDYWSPPTVACLHSGAPKKALQSCIWSTRDFFNKGTKWLKKYQCSQTYQKDRNSRWKKYLQRQPRKYHRIKYASSIQVYKNSASSPRSPTLKCPFIIKRRNNGRDCFHPRSQLRLSKVQSNVALA